MENCVSVMDQQKAMETLLKYEEEVKNSTAKDVSVYFWKKGCIQEITLRLVDLYSEVKEVAGKTICIGKIIVGKIIEFIEQHPNLAIGIALGAALGALTSLIPVIGPLLAPIVSLLSCITLGIAGEKKDKNLNNASEAMIELAMDFYKFFADIINTVYLSVEK